MQTLYFLEASFSSVPTLFFFFDSNYLFYHVFIQIFLKVTNTPILYSAVSNFISKVSRNSMNSLLFLLTVCFSNVGL